MEAIIDLEQQQEMEQAITNLLAQQMPRFTEAPTEVLVYRSRSNLTEPWRIAVALERASPLLRWHRLLKHPYWHVLMFDFDPFSLHLSKCTVAKAYKVFPALRFAQPIDALLVTGQQVAIDTLAKYFTEQANQSITPFPRMRANQGGQS